MSLVADYYQAVSSKDFRNQCLISSANVAWFMNRETKPEKPTIYYTTVNKAEDFINIATCKMYTKTYSIGINDLLGLVPALKSIPNLETKAIDNVLVFQFLESEPNSEPWNYLVPLNHIEAFGSEDIMKIFHSQIFNNVK